LGFGTKPPPRRRIIIVSWTTTNYILLAVPDIKLATILNLTVSA
jgi:hypothetical protein